MSDSKICLCLVTDEKNAPHAATALASAWEFTPSYPALIVGNRLSDDSICKFKRLASSFDAQVEVLDASSVDLSPFHAWGHWSNTVWLKLYLADLAPQCVERIVYIDTDIVCLSSISPLAEIDLNGCAFAAVSDLANTRKHRLGKLGIPKYFNTGVLVIDLAEWRNLGIKEKATRYAVEHAQDREMLAFVDQCAINAVAWDRALELSANWNVMINQLPIADADTVLTARILHFAAQKPWEDLGLPGANLYWHFRRKTPWTIEQKPRIEAFKEQIRLRTIRAKELAKVLVYSQINRKRAIVRAKRRLKSAERQLFFHRVCRPLIGHLLAEENIVKQKIPTPRAG